jgi:hypothetical protein
MSLRYTLKTQNTEMASYCRPLKERVMRSIIQGSVLTSHCLKHEGSQNGNMSRVKNHAIT